MLVPSVGPHRALGVNLCPCHKFVVEVLTPGRQMGNCLEMGSLPGYLVKVRSYLGRVALIQQYWCPSKK